MADYMYPFIDFHNHSQWHEDNEVLEIVSIHGDQQKDAKFYSYGYHPWWTMENLTQFQLEVMRQKYLTDPACLGLGEFGLDNLKGISVENQEAIFIQQLEIANEVNAPVVIHCVRAFDRLLRIRKEYGKTDWVIHGFVRNKILAKQVLDAGIYISLAPHLENNTTFNETLKFLPLERIFLETDSDFSLQIQSRYAIFAALRNVDVSVLKTIIYNNFAKFYQGKWKHQDGSKEQLY